jgi:hypothetical protein
MDSARCSEPGLAAARAFTAPALLLLAAIAAVVVCLKPLPAQANAGPAPDKVVAYYFHATFRCVTCRTIESYSREAIEQAFAKEIKDGRLEFRLVNMQLPENRHFVREYQLYTRSLVIVKVRAGKQLEWRNLAKVWDLVGDKGGFLKYVQSNVRAYLGAG